MGDHYEKHEEGHYERMQEREDIRKRNQSERDRLYKLIEKLGGVEALEELVRQGKYFGKGRNGDEYQCPSGMTQAQKFEKAWDIDEVDVAVQETRKLWDNSIDQDYKQDSGKVRFSTVPASLERAVAEIRAVGIAKYGDNERWREVSVERYFDAMLRHVNAMREHGLQAVDDESGCKHLHHVACNVAFLVELLGHE